jgi:hypothetical protein
LNGPFIHDLLEHILNTKDSQNIHGKYMLGNSLEVMDILDAIPIGRIKTLGQAYRLGSILRRHISYIQDGNPREALKMAHELQMEYERANGEDDKTV